MPKPQLPLFGLVATISLFLCPETCIAITRNKDCGSSMCGNVNINYPFRLKTQPPKCGGDPIFELDCDEKLNLTILALENAKFYVQDIDYDYHTIQLVDASLGTNTCSLPLSSLYYSTRFFDLCRASYFTVQLYFPSVMFLVNCTTPSKSSIYVDASRCPNSSSDPSSASYFYFLDEQTAPRDFNPSCTVIATVPIRVQNITGMSTLGIYENLSLGFELSWRIESCASGNSKFWTFFHRKYFAYYLFHHAPITLGYRFYSHAFPRKYPICLWTIGGILLSRMLLGMSILIALVTHKLRRRHLSVDDTIEEFLQSQNNLMPIRYSYYEVKRMTRGFRDKLGAGGFGSVFKGKLRSGHSVAIKLLDKSKSNGQDFINEVATIGRIHHVNVAKLIGFCVEGSKQALVYDFMPNGSLDRIIFAGENDKVNLSWEKMFDIALGVARGIEYLHQGCDMQILHFDIKPHNILLDENFTPKVSDFGLAKLYSVEKSIVSLTAARGTIGYIAPELVYKNLGGVSHKADVYSFGMLLMEMVGRRKNLNAFVEQSSQIYFPSWIYDRFDRGEDIELENVTADEKRIVRKMVIIAFWCIQVKPNDRPSMNKALQMLETDVELLQMPPKPFQLPFEISAEDHVDDNPNDEDPTTSLVSSNEISLEIA
ncbi:LEAF RUST 10 DISEASE-RESISTANCE LOCUS RECEPTOR-LIKE PROTEIN KINASE-like 2.4 [Durio zibethinus]|uniref:LEAF RUST 10 DISEASE-RESISTANCE LOCUS RECEPTOR-LIKE PROTEIN KINASE-like 2.4 n=1 Tax=Durio zibethinus TaxID=66656 RepID=A0A6P5ZGC5_DURZI|nr:LEAF RUST 10 DISEASE-RESISTANCE LOCUS RECEPTOR-LIKE PROTEIN KINASE-like 2.4 [Durio zibethinus]